MSSQDSRRTDGDRPPKVALAVPDLQLGGGERFTVYLANGLAARGCAVDLVLITALGPCLSHVSPQVRIVTLNSRRVLRSILPLARYLRKQRPDVLISNLEHMNFGALAAGRLAGVRFLMKREATLDEALAAADVVVVPNSGFGSDALVKGRLTIVLDLPGMRLGHGRELIEQAGCPRATNAEELAAAIRELSTDDTESRRHFAAAERYIADFCACFGQDSARRIAAIVRENLRQSPSALVAVPT